MDDSALPPPALRVSLSLLAGCSALGLWISYQNSERGVFGGRFLSDLSAGMLLSVAWLHLLDDASEKLEGRTVPDQLPEDAIPPSKRASSAGGEGE